MRKIKIAQIGAGHDHANAIISTLKQLDDVFEVVGYAVVDGDEENYEYYKKSYDGLKKMTVEEILNYPNLDAVTIETEDRNLTQFAKKAALKGLHIHMDKPGSVPDSEYDELISIVENNNSVFHVGYMYRYNPALIELKRKIRNGELGHIYSIEALMGCEHTAKKRQWLSNFPGGMMYYLGCHLVDLIYDILGEPLEVIPYNTQIGAENVSAEDFGMAVFKYKNGVSFLRTSALEIGGFQRREIVVCGTNGTVEIKPIEQCVENHGKVAPMIAKIRVKEPGHDLKYSGEESMTEEFDRYANMMKAFAEYILGEKDNPYSYEYEKNLHKLLLKACGLSE